MFHKILLLDKIGQFIAIPFFGKIKNWVKASLKPLTKKGMPPIMTILAKAVKPEVLQCQKVFQNRNGNILDSD